MTEQTFRTQPTSHLDLDLMLTNSVWGQTEVPQELRDRLSRHFLEEKQEIVEGETKTVKTVTTNSLWGLLGFYTRDMRLGNLSTFDNELQTCRYMLDLAGDLLQKEYIEPFLICLSRVATILETSQSKGGFLRKQMNTLTQQHLSQSMEPKKKGFFGGKAPQGPGGQY